MPDADRPGRAAWSPPSTREVVLAPFRHEGCSCGRGRIQPPRGTRTEGTYGSPLPCLHCLLPEPFPPFLQVLVHFQPSTASRCPAQWTRFSPQSQSSCLPCPSGPGWDRGSAGPEHPPCQKGSTEVSACRTSSQWEQQWPRRGGQQSCNTTPLPGTGARRGPAHPCPPRLSSLQRQ